MSPTSSVTYLIRRQMVTVCSFIQVLVVQACQKDEPDKTAAKSAKPFTATSTTGENTIPIPVRSL